MKYSRIMFAGPSGIGKTTLAKFISYTLEGAPEFISGSMSNLMPDTKTTPHQDILGEDSKYLYNLDYQLLNLRNKLFQDKPEFVSDRSYLDLAAYFVYKQDKSIPQCEIEHFISICKLLLNDHCDCLIFLNLNPRWANEWTIEDNSKRICNVYFQSHMSAIMNMVLDMMGYKYMRSVINYRSLRDNMPKILRGLVEMDYGFEEGVISSTRGKTHVFIINEPNRKIREDILQLILT